MQHVSCVLFVCVCVCVGGVGWAIRHAGCKAGPCRGTVTVRGPVQARQGLRSSERNSGEGKGLHQQGARMEGMFLSGNGGVLGRRGACMCCNSFFLPSWREALISSIGRQVYIVVLWLLKINSDRENGLQRGIPWDIGCPCRKHALLLCMKLAESCSILSRPLRLLGAKSWVVLVGMGVSDVLYTI